MCSILTYTLNARMFPFLPPAYKSFCQVCFLRVDRVVFYIRAQLADKIDQSSSNGTIENKGAFSNFVQFRSKLSASDFAIAS